mgnify:CR=1 FL=1
MLYLDLYRKYKSDHFKSIYCKFRNEYKFDINETKKLNILRNIDEAKNKCKKAWRVINSIAKNGKEEDVLLSPNDFNAFCVNSVQEICDSLIRPHVTPINLMAQAEKLYPPNFSFNEINYDVVLGVVKDLKSSDSIDIYGLSNNIIKRVIDCVVGPLVYLINRCLSDGMFPNTLKLSRVVPIYKKGDKSCPASYRPVSLTPVFSKIIVCAKIFETSKIRTNLIYIGSTTFASAVFQEMALAVCGGENKQM